MTEEFNKWWNNDLLTENNPYVDSTPAFWAWEGWCAAVKAEREACAKVCDSEAGLHERLDRNGRSRHIDDAAVAKTCAAAIRARGNT
jgi:hypothetical protein